jgi:hypothetical protein
VRPLFRNSILLFSVLLIVSCNVQKRVHRKGYYITHHKKTESPTKNKVIEHEEVYASAKVLPLSVSDHQQLISFEKPSERTMPGDTCGDVLVLSNFLELQVKVLNISDSTVEYKSCSDLGGKGDHMMLKNIKMIRFSNGSETFYDRTFEQDVKKPLCYDQIILNDETKLKAKILNENQREIMYVDCSKPGVIQKMEQKDVKKLPYYNELLFAEDEDEELKSKLKGSFVLSFISLLVSSLVPVFYSMFGGGGITGFTFLVALGLYTIAMVVAWRLYEKISHKRDTKLNKRAKRNLIFAFLPVELLVIATVLFVFVFTIVLIIALALSQ